MANVSESFDLITTCKHVQLFTRKVWEFLGLKTQIYSFFHHPAINSKHIYITAETEAGLWQHTHNRVCLWRPIIKGLQPPINTHDITFSMVTISVLWVSAGCGSPEEQLSVIWFAAKRSGFKLPLIAENNRRETWWVGVCESKYYLHASSCEIKIWARSSWSFIKPLTSMTVTCSQRPLWSAANRDVITLFCYKSTLSIK